MNIMIYKNYIGQFEYDNTAKIFHGRVINIQDIVTFEGRSSDELEKALQDSIEDYLAFCEEIGRAPNKPFSGRFNIRLRPEVHHWVSTAAKITGQSLNQWIAEILEREAQKQISEATKITRSRLKLPVSPTTGGVLPGVDLNISSDLEEVMNKP